MTREEALESGIRRALVVWGGHDDVELVGRFVEQFLQGSGPALDSSELEGFAVGLQLVAVEVAEIARKRREVMAATLETPASKPGGEAFTYERVEVAGPAGDPVWIYERRPQRTR